MRSFIDFNRYHPLPRNTSTSSQHTEALGENGTKEDPSHTQLTGENGIASNPGIGVGGPGKTYQGPPGQVGGPPPGTSGGGPVAHTQWVTVPGPGEAVES